MLVIARKPGQTVELFHGGAHVGTIKIKAIHGSKVVLGFDCPEVLTVIRTELTETDRRESGTDAATDGHARKR